MSNARSIQDEIASSPETVIVTPPVEADDEVACSLEPVIVPSPVEYPVFDELLTSNQTALLDLIDKLRNHDVSDIIDFPQIIVCGDQSSGKSSVLEAISRVSFPKDSSVCTLFPTELALRRGPTRKVKVQLRPSPKRTDKEVREFKQWDYETNNIDEFPNLVKQAKAGLYAATGIDPTTSSFFADTLHVEVTDPHWPLLTVVDLPGIISAANPEQKEEDVDIPWQLCSQYMANKKSIILAVIGADTQTNVTGIWKLIKQHDPDRKRTICVFTKPDLAQYAEDTIPKFVDFATNKTQGWHYELGWHVVRNGGPRDFYSSLNDRDAMERKFFAQQRWVKSLNKHQLGVNNLRNRLSKLLEKHIREEMPKLMDEIKEKLADAKQERARLGDARPDTKAQRAYLTQLSTKFQRIVEYAVNGQYENEVTFFPPEPTIGDAHLLRSSIRHLNQQFYSNMCFAGHSVLIVEPDPPNAAPNTPLKCWPSFEAIDLYDEIPSTEEEPEHVTREDYLKEIRKESTARMGIEMIGSVNPQLPNIIFKKQARPWGKLAKDHLRDVCKCIWNHFDLVADHIASKDTASALKHYLLYDYLEARESKVEQKLEELLKPYVKGHRVAEDPSYLLHAMRSANDRAREATRSTLENYQHSNKNMNFHPSPALNIPEVVNALHTDKVASAGELFFGNTLTMVQAYYDVSSNELDSFTWIC
jgi:GTPase SAR1 family protein